MTHLPSAPGQLIAGLPRTLGRDLSGEVALLGLSPAAAHVAVLLVTELEAGPGWITGTADAMLSAAAQDGATTFAAVVYADDAEDVHSPAAQTAAALCLRASHFGLRYLDALWVSRGRWGSYLCPEPRCCPPGGSAIPTPEETP